MRGKAFFFTGRIITFYQCLEGEKDGREGRIARSGIEVDDKITWRGEQGIGGKNPRNCFFFLLRTQQIMDFQDATDNLAQWPHNEKKKRENDKKKLH